jgi:hypothetical protein
MPKKACRGAKIEKSENGAPSWIVPAFKTYANSRVRDFDAVDADDGNLFTNYWQKVELV